MTQGTDVLSPERGTVESQEVNRVTAVCTPAVDIVERRDDVLLTVDLPGVDDGALEVNVENGILTIAGQSRLESVQGFEPVYREHVAVAYRRVLRLSDRLNPAGITAHLRQGVLRLAVPKREEIKARRVPISAG
ncbi:MAG: Hsp20/alpha crystallin family protein [Lentisphaerae bacterium]|nr:Hsp20/alpha crystallin family protein [Lentisphaerota bacterium]